MHAYLRGPSRTLLALAAAALCIPLPVSATDGGAAPVVTFDWDPTGPGVGELVRFRDLSTDADNDISTWSWTFEPDGFSSIQNPTHAFSDAGSMTVTLTVTDLKGHSATLSREIVVRVAPEAPVASFTWNPASPTTTETVVFHDASTDPDGTIRSWSWDLGDGSTSTEQDPAHRYASPGQYLVTLTVTDDEQRSSSVQQWVTVRNTEPFADIRVRPREPLEGNEVVLTSRSRDADGDALTHDWDLGDGNTSNATEVTHTYAMAGTYEVRLTVTDPHGGLDSTTETLIIAAAPSALGGSLPPGEAQRLLDNATAGTAELPAGTFRETLGIGGDLRVIGDGTIVDGRDFPAIIIRGGTVHLESLTLRSEARALQMHDAWRVELVNVTVEGDVTADGVRLVRWWTPADEEPRLPDLEAGLAVHGHFIELRLTDAAGSALNDTEVTLIQDGIAGPMMVTDERGGLPLLRIAHTYHDGNETGSNRTELRVDGSLPTYELDPHDALQTIATDVERGGTGNGLPSPSAAIVVLVSSLVALAVRQRRAR